MANISTPSDATRSVPAALAPEEASAEALSQASVRNEAGEGRSSRLEEFFSFSFPGGPREEARAREAAYHQELVHLFQQRVRILTSITLLVLPAFALLHGLLSASTRRSVALTHLVLLLTCLAVRALAPRLKRLQSLRALVFGAYTLYFVGAAAVCIQLSSPDVQAQVANHFIALCAFEQIVLSVMVLPLSTGEVAFIVGCGVASMGLAVSWALKPVLEQALGYVVGQGIEVNALQQLYLSHLFSFVFASVIVICLAHLNAVQRRSAFEAAWELRISAAQLEKLSTLDPVTGGWNRRRLEEVLHEEIARAARFERHFVVLMFDLDNFKVVNDTRGHAAGDDVLRLIYQAAVETVRQIDTVARFGSDEFVVVLPETSPEAAVTMAARLQDAVRDRLLQTWPPLSAQSKVTLSIGIFTSREATHLSVSSLLAGADGRLYSAKRAGKNQVSVSSLAP